jgi:hypothetical protein
MLQKSGFNFGNWLSGCQEVKRAKRVSMGIIWRG